MGGMGMLEDLKRAAWARTEAVPGQSSWEFRRDRSGNLLRYADYGNRHSPFGWELEYIIPRSAGGSQGADNLQALHWKQIPMRPTPELRLATIDEARGPRR